jgi:hypothetical protein
MKKQNSSVVIGLVVIAAALVAVAVATNFIVTPAYSDSTSGVSSDSGTGTQMGICVIGVESPCNGKP